jgi:glucose/arabinose dehydrogenase
MTSLKITSLPGKAFFLGIQLLLILSISPAATVNVDVVDYAFSPDQVTINVNDTVQWNWQGFYHSTTSLDSLWDSGVNNPPFSYPFTFTSPGTYNYLCSVHYFYGTVTVQAGNVAPSISITNPIDGASFVAPATVTIAASAEDSDGTVANVQFFDGVTSLGSAASSPYSVSASLAVGAHALTAVATDDGGLSTTSSVVNITVNVPIIPLGIVITNPPDNSTNGNTDTITIQSAVSGSGGSVTNVQYFDGTNSLGNRTTSPYNFSTTLPLGLHLLTALASDNLGATATSAPVHVAIARYTPPITNGNSAIFLVPIATNLAAPDYAISPPGDASRLFVLEQNGLIRVIQNGVLLSTPALDITNRVQPPLVASNPNDERGLLGLAFHPGYNNPASPGYRTLYTYNSEQTNGTLVYPCPANAVNNYRNVVNEWKITTTNASVIDPTSRREIISFGKNAGNHNGGTITFGPDGYAYLALGDGGNSNDTGTGHIVPGGNAQNLTTPLGKMLRFDPLNPALTPSSLDPASPNGQYRIPASNPFHGPGQVPEIFAYGLRNPYRFAFDFVTGNLIEGDVGQNNIEEINCITNGGNYGWAVKEGDFLFNQTNSAVNPTNVPSGPAGTIGTPPTGYFTNGPARFTDPISGPMGILEYDHNNGISISGGFVYRGQAIPQLYGKYIFGDLALVPTPVRVNGRIFYADLQTGAMNAIPLILQFGTDYLPNGLTVHGFGQDADGELYALATNTSANGNGGVVYKLVAVSLVASKNGNQLDISWPVIAGHLEAQTNNLGVGIGTNWVVVAGSAATNHVVVPLDQANGNGFYRLVVP